MMRRSFRKGTGGITRRGIVAYWDAGNSSSYPGSGTIWSNLISAPADGSAQSDYNIRLGDGSTSTTYPTFNGSAGSSTAYWSFDGGDYFELDSHVNTTFLNSISQNNAVYSWWWVYRMADTTDFQCILSTGTATGSVGFFYGAFNVTDKNALVILRGTGGSTALNKEADSTTPTGSYVFEGMSIDETGSGFFFRNGSYLQVGGSDTFTAAYSSPSASSAGYLVVCAANTLQYKFRNGGRFATLATYNVALSLAEMQTNYNAFVGRYL